MCELRPSPPSAVAARGGGKLLAGAGSPREKVRVALTSPRRTALLARTCNHMPFPFVSLHLSFKFF